MKGAPTSQFYAIDGEAHTTATGHKYVLMAGSDGDHIYDPDELDTNKCFQWLLSKAKRRRVLVCFGLTYDANMMIWNLPPNALRKLHETNTCYWRQYRIEHVPRKWLTITDRNYKKSVKIYEVFGYFQASFLKSLKAWGLEPPREVVEGKQNRSAFTEENFDSTLKYCIKECELLVQLMTSLKSSMYSVDIRPRTWNGAGTVAAALLQSNNISEYHKHDRDHGAEILGPILHGYFGGRVELYKQGQFDTIHNYDIISAYPAAIANLPDLSSGKWSRRKKFTDKHPGIWRVHWRGVRGMITPFPVRYKKAIHYPTTGDGYYHTVEVAAALAAGFTLDIQHGYTYHPDTDVKPFDFIPELFEYRKLLKSKKHAGEKAVKLGLNSVYGKLAQGIGYKGKKPRYQSYFWAGQVTADSRAKLLRAIMTDPGNMVMVATDGIFCQEPLDIELGENLGDWETQVYTDMFTAQPGAYRGFQDGEEIKKTRGFFAHEIDYDALIKAWHEEGEDAVFRYESQRFVGLGTALLAKGDPSKEDRPDASIKDNWRTWPTEKRKLVVRPNRRSPGPRETSATHNAILHLPEPRICGLSEPYVPRTREVEADILKDIVQGGEQPLAVNV